MSATRLNLTEADLHRLQQALKWIVYTLLLINFGFYISEDWNRAVHTLTAEATFGDWAGEFATSIDEAAWFLLLAMFELETYVLEDEQLEGRVGHILRGVRLICFAMLAHTVFAYATTVVEYRPDVKVEAAAGPCGLAARNFSWVHNLEYTAITAENCDDLTNSDALYRLGNRPVVTDMAGLRLERRLAWVDLVEAVVWLVIVLAIEFVVRMQERGITHSPLIRAANATKVGLYVLLFGIATWWASLSHWLYAWDEFLWIAGFAVIEMNVSDWRKELMQGHAGSDA